MSIFFKNLYYARVLVIESARGISSSCSYQNRNHYDALKISRGATQSEIKSAYYKLSMQFHPDKNQGSDEAAKKFREITVAYEVLGNYRLRRLYDKGILHTAGSQYQDTATTVEPEVEDDPETKFYKSRFRKSKVADDAGRTPIYDFDEWSRAHYGKSFERRQEAKQKFADMQERRQRNKLGMQSEIVIFGAFITLVSVYLIFIAEQSYDTPKAIAQEKYRQRMLLEKEKLEQPTTSNSEAR